MSHFLVCVRAGLLQDLKGAMCIIDGAAMLEDGFVQSNMSSKLCSFSGQMRPAAILEDGIPTYISLENVTTLELPHPDSPTFCLPRALGLCFDLF